MNISEKYIVAIDLGTSKIALTVAKVSGEDVQLIYYKETPSAGIRYSSVFNETTVTGVVSKALHEAEEELGIKITSAVVGMPKFPVVQQSNTAKIEERGEDCDITEEDIAYLKRFAEESYPLEDEQKEAIYGAVAQSFSDGENFQIIEKDIIGMTGDTVEGNFRVFIGNKRSLNKIDHVMNRIGIPAIRKYFTADSTAKAVLTDAEMENGVALVDFGGGCTSVSIYHGKIMRHYASIPFGGNNITNDIKSECQISDTLAENIKLGYGACMPEKLQNLSEKIIHIRSNSAEPDKQLPVKYLSEIITARIEEIMMAILYEIDRSGFADMLRSGIVITGGCAQTANLCNFIYDISGYKVRTGYPRGLFSCQGCDGTSDTSASSSIGLILAAVSDKTINCAVNNEDIEASETDTVMGAPVEEEPVIVSESESGKLFEFETVEPEKKPVEPKPKKKPKITWAEKIKNTLFSIYESANDETSEA
ncbi:MAG: cell division protein FtsA [Candidatus Cryptobacteroides sp.]